MMAPFKSNGRGSFMLKRRYRGVAPIRRASGTTDAAVFARLEAMCDTLYEQGRHDILDGIARGYLKPLQVWSRFKFNALDELPHADTLPDLLDAFATWVTGEVTGEENRRGRRTVLRRFQTQARKGMTVGDLPRLLKEERERSEKRGRAFNLERDAASAFVRDKLGDGHRLYAAVRAVPPLPVTNKQKRRAFTVEQLRELVKQMGQPHGAMAWTIAVTGMGPKEYWKAKWSVEDEGGVRFVVIHGTKREGRDRVVPWVCPLTTPQRSLGRFRKRYAVHAGGRTLYDLRRSFSAAMANARLPESRKQSYMGHGPKNVTQWYEMTDEMREHLAADGEALRRYFGEASGAALRLEKA